MKGPISDTLENWRVATSRLLIAAFVLLLVGNCFAQQGNAERAPANPTDQIIGSWEGTTLATCGLQTMPDRCNAEQKVTITLSQNENGKIVGHYSCAYGTMNCLHMNETGKVGSVSLNGKRLILRVLMPDGLSYLFNGRVNDGEITGGYTAMSGGSAIERGIWRARHAY